MEKALKKALIDDYETRKAADEIVADNPPDVSDVALHIGIKLTQMTQFQRFLLKLRSKLRMELKSQIPF